MKIGLALSGGGIRGIAHAGVLKAFEEHNIKIDIMGGTSSGSMVASLYAMGYCPDEIYEYCKKYAKQIAAISSGPIITGITDYIRKREIRIKGLKSNERLEKVCDNLALKKGITSMNDIKIPIIIPTVDLISEKEFIFTNNVPENTCKNNEKHYITNISVGKAVRASSNFSAIFSPFEFENYAFIDGGLLDNVPAEEVRKQGADKVISVKFESDKIDKKSNIMDIIMKSIDIMGEKIFEPNISSSDYVLTVSTDGTGLFDLDKTDLCFESGYKTAMEYIDEIKKVIY